MLRNELEVTEIGEQLYRYRKRLALTQFFDLYEFAQKNPLFFLQEDSKTIQKSSRNVTKHGPRRDSRVLSRIVDLMFPNTAHTNEITVAAGNKSRRMPEEGQRAAAVRKIQDWRRNGKPWSAMVKRSVGEFYCCWQRASLMRSKCGASYFEDPYHFAHTSSANIANASLRTMKAATFENLLTTMESILSQSLVLLRSASALSRSLIRCQAPAEMLRLGTDDTLLDADTEYSRQDLDALLEPCGVVTPLRESTEPTVQVEESSDSRALGPSLSSLRSIRVSASRPIDSKRFEAPKAGLSISKLPAKRGLSTISSDISSPARLLTPTFFNSTVVSNLSSPARLTPPAFFNSTVNFNVNSPARLPTPACFHDPLDDLRTPSLASPVWWQSKNNPILHRMPRPPVQGGIVIIQGMFGLPSEQYPFATTRLGYTHNSMPPKALWSRDRQNGCVRPVERVWIGDQRMRFQCGEWLHLSQ